MSVLENNIRAKIIETKSIEANITIKKLLEMVCKHWMKCLDNYYIVEGEPELDTNESNSSVTVGISNTEAVDIEGIIDDVTMLFEEDLETYIKEQEALAKMPREEGESGVL